MELNIIIYDNCYVLLNKPKKKLELVVDILGGGEGVSYGVPVEILEKGLRFVITFVPVYHK